MLIPLSGSLDDGHHTAANEVLIWVSAELCIKVRGIEVENTRLRWYRKTLKTEFYGVQQYVEQSSELKIRD